MIPLIEARVCDAKREVLFSLIRDPLPLTGPSTCSLLFPVIRWLQGQTFLLWELTAFQTFLSVPFFPQNLLQCALRAGQHFSTFSVQTDHLRVLLKGRFWFSRTRTKSKTLHFPYTLSWESCWLMSTLCRGKNIHFENQNRNPHSYQHLNWVNPRKQFISLSSETFPWCLISTSFISHKSGFKSTSHWLGYFRQVV